MRVNFKNIDHILVNIIFMDIKKEGSLAPTRDIVDWQSKLFDKFR